MSNNDRFVISQPNRLSHLISKSGLNVPGCPLGEQGEHCRVAYRKYRNKNEIRYWWSPKPEDTFYPFMLFSLGGIQAKRQLSLDYTCVSTTCCKSNYHICKFVVSASAFILIMFKKKA